jgi:hypothetical protein
MAWLALLVVAGLDAYAFYRGNETQSTVLTGILCMMLGMSREQAAVAAIAVRAASNAQVAADISADTAAKADDKLTTIAEAVKDIQDNPVMPGTPGWMDERASS